MYGYDIINGKAVINREEAANVVGLYEGYLEGLSMAKAGAMIPRTQVSIGHMLENRQYLGTEFYPPIIDQKLFERVQDARAARYVPGRQGGSKRRREAQPIYNSFRLSKRPKVTTGGVEALASVYKLVEIAEENVVPDIQITVMTRPTNITSNAG